ncbi:nuclear receptor-interacting protein 1 [Corythoichthys intestinalis]|uniref:nuclear receptor-interacting protein 1 n=1 Tax=Corythoichthys intestinalis TaxID=161448 RepID=UPI0025A5EBC4|nr:nuclear receptor-interacting protein 1 [Corythoichthys intestinalis]XP_057676095.1 nuclear receptor-interacting protein 1 [Corythoichthys intestinalis]
MTHGEEPGPETHKDSAVLTYLEGLLMHPVVAGPGATASRRSEAAHSNQDQGDKVGSPFQLPTHSPTAPKTGTNGPTMGASQHLKKARLLRSGAWNDPSNHCLTSPPVELNGQAGGLQNGSHEDSPHGGESTLLASLLQSFSTRLQNVAMSQHTNKPPSERSSPSTAPPTDNPNPVYGTASSRLKGLMRKNKLHNHSNTPYSRRGHSHDRPPESPRAAHSATPPSATAASESVSCADRLKAVANMVKVRSSPAPSPKPSVACSQLALLLSSEAHLQQYSREHALKAQLSGRSASERLAAMANQQHSLDKRPPSVGGTLQGTPEKLSSVTTQNEMTTTNTQTTTLPRLALSSPQSPPMLCGHIKSSSSPTPPHALGNFHSQPSREKKGFDSRPTRPPQTCSSLLLLLLNNHNNQKQLTKNGHLEDSCSVLPPSGSSSVTSDSECSTHEKSLAKDSSDAETSYSSCSPMDLSMRNWAKKQDIAPKSSTPSSSSASFSILTHTVSAFSTPVSSGYSSAPSFNTVLSPPPTVVSSAPNSISSYSSLSTSSLHKLTESLVEKWNPESSGKNMVKNKKHEINPDLKSQSKVTLMQLLLERRNNDVVNKNTDEDLPLDITMATMSRSQPNLVSWEEPRTKSPINKPAAPAQPTYTLNRDPGDTISPHPPSPPGQSSPLDLCKSKAFQPEKGSEASFSASKLLQNLAKSGVASSSPPIPSGKGLGQELDTSSPLSLLERLNAPVNRSTTATPLSDIPANNRETFPPPSQIENLLERRTVLQLLLGAGSTTGSVSCKDRPEGSGGRSAELERGSYDRISNICDSADVSAVDVKVKTEEGVGPSSNKYEDLINRKRQSNLEKRSPLSDTDLQAEHRPAEVIAKYGLLSQLLKHQTATYYSSAAVQNESQPRQVKEEKTEYPSPSPKKRRLCSDQTDSLDNSNSHRAFQRGDTNSFTTPGVQVEPEKQKLQKEEEFSTRSQARESFTRENRGFNVLKQLLLSDNCLKELSKQHRGAPSPSILQSNGNTLCQPTPHNHGFLHLPSWHPHSSLNSGLSSNVRTLPTPPTSDSLIRSPQNHHPAPWQGTQKRDTPNLVKQELESPIQWSSHENHEGCDSNPDSPRLSRSNPILYYMLQKGSVQFRKEVKNQAEGPQSVVKIIKEEPISDLHAYEQNLSSTPQSPASRHDKHSQDNQRLSQSSE